MKKLLFFGIVVLCTGVFLGGWMHMFNPKLSVEPQDLSGKVGCERNWQKPGLVVLCHLEHTILCDRFAL